LRRVRSQISVISSTGETGTATRLSSPRCSRTRMKSRRSVYFIRLLDKSAEGRRPDEKPGPVLPPAFSPRRLAARRSLTLHGHEEFVVGLGVLELVEEELDGGDLVHRVQQLAQDPDALQLVLGGQQLLATGA